MSAQGDFGNKSITIAPSGGNMDVAPSGNSISNPRTFGSAATSSGSIEAKDPNRNFGKTNNFANPNEKVVENLNKKEGEVDNAIRKNQYMGDFKTKSITVKVAYRDHEYPDGDLIRVYINDVIFKQGILLDSESQGFELELVPGFNKIDFEALNQGTSGPNTAQFEIYADDGSLISTNKWNLATGFKATVIVVKE